jgi:MFS family permease
MRPAPREPPEPDEVAPRLVLLPPAPPPPRANPLVASETVAARGPGSVVETAPPRTPSFLHGFRALRHRDFRLFYGGQLISLIGTWMQSLAQSWLILVLTNSAIALGLVGALQFLPVLLFSAFGGTLADFAPKRQVLLATQTAQMLLAFVLAGLVFTGAATYFDVLLLALLLGVANSIDMPTRQAFVVELVGGDDLPNAIALNSSLFNAARLVGPALAGLLIGSIGIAGCFFLNGVSFLAVIVGLLLIRPSAQKHHRLRSFRQVWLNLREGFRYVCRAPTIVAVIVVVGVLGTFGANFNVVVPLMAANTLQVGAIGLGWLMAAMGLGSLVASLGLAYLSREPRPVVILGSALAFSVVEIALAPVTTFWLALVLLALIGATMVTVTAVSNTYIQLAVPHRLRGRVMSIYTTVFVGTTPIGNALAGGLAEQTGPFGPLFYGGLVTLAGALWFGYQFLRNREAWRHRTPG